MVDKCWLSSYDSVVAHEISPEKRPLHEFIIAAARNFPEKVAVKQGGQQLTYSEFNRLTEIVAGNLRIHGLEKQNRVAVFLPNCSETIVAFWSITRAGAVGVMTNPLYSETELLHQFNDSGSRFVITNDLLLPKVAAVLEHTSVEKVFVVPASEEGTSIVPESARIAPWARLLEDNHG